jgi:hypothetical protein
VEPEAPGDGAIEGEVLAGALGVGAVDGDGEADGPVDPHAATRATTATAARRRGERRRREGAAAGGFVVAGIGPGLLHGSAPRAVIRRSGISMSLS